MINKKRATNKGRDGSEERRLGVVVVRGPGCLQIRRHSNCPAVRLVVHSAGVEASESSGETWSGSTVRRDE